MSAHCMGRSDRLHRNVDKRKTSQKRNPSRTLLASMSSYIVYKTLHLGISGESCVHVRDKLGGNATFSRRGKHATLADKIIRESGYEGANIGSSDVGIQRRTDANLEFANFNIIKQRQVSSDLTKVMFSTSQLWLLCRVCPRVWG